LLFFLTNFSAVVEIAILQKFAPTKRTHTNSQCPPFL
jgi:hypothetical protein